MAKFDFKLWLSDNPHKAAFVALVIFLVLVAFCLLLTGCNVTRTVTTKAEYYQKGDTTIQIVTRTTESYDGKVDATKLLTK